MIKFLEKLFGCWHEYKFLHEHGVTYQQFKCTKCGKLKIVTQM